MPSPIRIDQESGHFALPGLGMLGAATAIAPPDAGLATISAVPTPLLPSTAASKLCSAARESCLRNWRAPSATQQSRPLQPSQVPTTLTHPLPLAERIHQAKRDHSLCIPLKPQLHPRRACGGHVPDPLAWLPRTAS